MAGKNLISVEGSVIERLPNAIFRVELPNGHRILAHLPEKMRLELNQPLPGGKVMIEINPCDLSKGQITSRDRQANF
jgi:translation initiation factor IF-1